VAPLATGRAEVALTAGPAAIDVAGGLSTGELCPKPERISAEAGRIRVRGEVFGGGVPIGRSHIAFSDARQVDELPRAVIEARRARDRRRRGRGCPPAAARAARIGDNAWPVGSPRCFTSA
jgi:hypothetical protein